MPTRISRAEWESNEAEWYWAAMQEYGHSRMQWYEAPPMMADYAGETTRGVFALLGVELGLREEQQ